MRTRAGLVALSCLLATLAVASPARGAAPRRMTLLIVAGQSNALGFQSYVVDPKTHVNVFTSSTSPADRKVLLMWTESGVPSSGANPVALQTPQQLQGAPSAVFGPEVGLARQLYALGHRNLLVVKVAFSGSSLAGDWRPGSTPTSEDLEALLTRVRQAEAWAKSRGWTPVVGAFYWMQGESDALQASWAAAYAANLAALLHEVRTDLHFTSTTPIVIGQIDLADYITSQKNLGLCSASTKPTCTQYDQWNAEVMQAQADAAAKYVYVASTASLPRYEDFLHLSNSAELSLGKHFATLSSKHLG